MVVKFAEMPSVKYMHIGELLNFSQFLIEYTCPQMPEPAGCSVGVLSWWEQIGNIIFSEGATFYICSGINNDCSLPSKR